MSRDTVDQAGPDAPQPHREALVIGEDEARLLTRAALADAGLCATDARQVADALVDTSLRGIENYGLRLLPHYLDELAAGVADPTATTRVVSDRGAGLLIDADGALGVVAGMAAAQLAAKRAAKFGVAAVAVRNCNDFGAASVYTRQLARDGLVGIVVTSASCGGVEPLFGTDPNSLVQNDEFALETADSHQALAMAGALLGRVLTGAPLDREPAGESRGVGHLLIAVDPAAFGGHAELGSGLADLLGGCRADADLPRTPRSQAIPLDARTADVLFPLAEYFGVPGPRSVFAG
ncbi:hypothetical protein A9W99_04225 [Mycobacterium sp. 1164966.3]|nr:hypothetical protein A9W99_04225 [Mycobacterium sp. 1164966.3]